MFDGAKLLLFLELEVLDDGAGAFVPMVVFGDMAAVVVHFDTDRVGGIDTGRVGSKDINRICREEGICVRSVVTFFVGITDRDIGLFAPFVLDGDFDVLDGLCFSVRHFAGDLNGSVGHAIFTNRFGDAVFGSTTAGIDS